MGPKLLFVLGIVAGPRGFGCGLGEQEAPRFRVSGATCVNVPGPLPYFQPPREILAMLVPIASEDLAAAVNAALMIDGLTTPSPMRPSRMRSARVESVP